MANDRHIEDGGGHDGLAPSAEERRGERARAARPFVAAFPIQDDDVLHAEPGMSLSEYYAGEAFKTVIEREYWPIGVTRAEEIAKAAFDLGEAMEAEALRRRGGA